MTTAMVSMKAVVNHWAAPLPTSKWYFRSGIALIMIVSLRITMNVAATSQRSTAMSAGLVRAGAVGVEVSCDMGDSFARSLICRGLVYAPVPSCHTYDERDP